MGAIVPFLASLASSVFGRLAKRLTADLFIDLLVAVTGHWVKEYEEAAKLTPEKDDDRRAALIRKAHTLLTEEKGSE